ncbi:MAG: DUF4440 domain-containing protein [Rudaea sp.]|nr:DUF4440 domain-containing protein [Rudaea sp.]
MRLIASCICIAVLLFLGACSRTSDEQRIRAAIAAMQQAMEAHQPRDFLAYVDADFAGSNGNGNDGSVDRAMLGNILRAEVLRNDRIGVNLGSIDVDIQGNRATARVAATLTGGGANGLLPERGAVYWIVSGWKKDGRDWRCYNASWQQRP